MDDDRERFQPALYTLLTGLDAGVDPLPIAMLPGRFAQRAHEKLDLCRGDWPENLQDLICGACGAEGRYDVGKVLMWVEGHADVLYTFTGYFRCRSCDAGGPWAAPQELALLASLAAHALDLPLAATPWAFGRMELFDGFRPHSSAEAEDHLLRLAGQNPSDLQILIRLTNSYLTGGRPDLALAVAERVLASDPAHFEALLLAGHILHRLDAAQAALHLRLALVAARGYRSLPREEMQKLVAAAFRDLRRIQVASGDVPLFPSDEEIAAGQTSADAWPRAALEEWWSREGGSDPQSLLRLADLWLRPDRLPAQASERRGSLLPSGDVPLRRTTPPGRNDPCPCGSGRKYKRCCGREG